jgi:hypothetical protein
MLGEPDQFVGQELQRPTRTTLRRLGTGGCDQEGFLFARQLAGGSRTTPFLERSFQIPQHEATFGPIDRGAANPNTGRDHLVSGPRIGSKQNLRSLELADRSLAAAQQG